MLTIVSDKQQDQGVSHKVFMKYTLLGMPCLQVLCNYGLQS